MAQHIAAGGVVYRVKNGEISILLVKDRYGRWTWPKGHLEEGETPEEGALREIAEETGQFDTDIISKIGEQRYSYELEGSTVNKIVHVFLVKTAGQDIVPQKEELEAAEWFSPEKALKTIEYEGSGDLLRQALDKIEL